MFLPISKKLSVIQSDTIVGQNLSPLDMLTLILQIAQ